jgi:two-component system NtrC family sensor kinase
MTALPPDVETDLREENARLTRELRAARDRQAASAEILRAVAGAPGDAKRLLQRIAEITERLFGASSVTIRTIEGEEWGRLIRVGDAKRISQEIPEAQLRFGARNLASAVVLENRQIHIPDLDNVDPAIADWPGLRPARAAGIRVIVGTPLRWEGKAIGALMVQRDRPEPFTAEELALQQSFADQAVIAIENARLFDEVQAKTSDLSEALQQQTATAEVLKVISRSTFDLKAVLTTLVQSARELCDAPQGMVLLRDGEIYRTAMQLGYPPEFERYILENPIQPNLHSGAGRAAFTGQVAHFPDVLADPEYRLSEGQRLGGYRAMLSIPLMREEEVVGVFSLGRTEPDPFTPRQIELVQTFADQAVIAIENVRLFDEVQARTRELATSLDELRTAQDRLVQTEKLASLGQLTAGIAHEIKNPLNFVNNFSALSAELTDELNDALKPATLDDKTREEVDELTRMLKDNLEKVVQHGKRADSIVKNMLLHSREGSGEHRPADINALLDESLNLAYHGARAEKQEFNVTLQRDFDAGAGTIEVFPQEITRVFLNLISNGFYAVTKRKTEGDSGFEPLLSATSKDLGDRVEIRIRDNGTGIPPEVKEKMFNPFFTTKPAGEGTGLGLSMSHDIIVKQHGGTIDVETEPGQFTEFRIVLPRTSGHSDKNRGQT